ncbi:hypothetical protein DsansV1_C05g0056171 [Dioscorea sansibarensis]
MTVDLMKLFSGLKNQMIWLYELLRQNLVEVKSGLNLCSGLKIR